MKPEGFFPFNRSTFDSWVWKDPLALRLLLIIVGGAVFGENQFIDKDIIVKRGQFLRSLRKLQGDLEYIHNNAVKHYDISTISRAIKKLEEGGFITTTETRLGTLFTVANYDEFPGIQAENLLCQARESSKKTKLATEPAIALQHSRNNNNNDKNDKNNIYTSILNHWNSKDILEQRELTARIKKAIENKLKYYTVDEIKQAIDNYGYLLKDNSYFISRPFGFSEFLNNGLVNFFDLEKAKAKYPSKTKPEIVQYNQTQVRFLN